MDRAAWLAMVHGVTESDTTKVTKHACTFNEVLLQFFSMWEKCGLYRLGNSKIYLVIYLGSDVTNSWFQVWWISKLNVNNKVKLYFVPEQWNISWICITNIREKVSTECPTKNELIYTSFKKKKGIDMFLFALQTFSSIRRKNGWKHFI